MKSRIQRLIEELQHEKAMQVIDERIADEAASEFGLTKRERDAYLELIHPAMLPTPATTVAAALAGF